MMFSVVSGAQGYQVLCGIIFLISVDVVNGQVCCDLANDTAFVALKY
jgi:hypothetical protein